MKPLRHQETALTEIICRARAFFDGAWRDLPIQPRWATLMVGPTGTGKTAVAAMAAEAIGASMLRVSVPGWMPSGATGRGTEVTIAVILKAVIQNKKLILVFDELDKILASDHASPWQSYIRGEIFELLDGRWPTGLELPDDDTQEIEELTKMLRENVFVIGIATFQSWFDAEPPTITRNIGFGSVEQVANITDSKELSAALVAQKLPRELANRWNTQLVRIPEIVADDYHVIANQTAELLPETMRDEFMLEVNRQIDEAIKTKKGVRFLEEVVMHVIKKAQIDIKEVLPIAPPSDPFDDPLDLWSSL